MISPRQQWLTDGDLVDVERDVRVALDYDLKRKPERVGERQGCLLVEGTVPWRDRAEFLDWREALALWRERTGRVLKTLADWTDFLAFREALARTGASRRVGRNLPPLARVLMAAWDRGEAGLPRDRTAGRGRGGGWSTAPDRRRALGRLRRAGHGQDGREGGEGTAAAGRAPVGAGTGMLERLAAMVPGVRVAELCRTPPEALVDSLPEIAARPEPAEMLGHQTASGIASPSATGGTGRGRLSAAWHEAARRSGRDRSPPAPHHIWGAVRGRAEDDAVSGTEVDGQGRREVVSARVKAIEAELWDEASPHEREAAMRGLPGHGPAGPAARCTAGNRQNRVFRHPSQAISDGSARPIAGPACRTPGPSPARPRSTPWWPGSPRPSSSCSRTARRGPRPPSSRRSPADTTART